MQSSGKRVLIVLTSNDDLGDSGQKTGWYLPEAAHPYNVFKAAGCTISWASPKGGEAPVDADSLDMNDAGNKTFWENEETKNMTKNTMKLSDCKSDDYDCIFFAGGFGVMWDFPDDPDVHRLSKEMYEANKIVAAVCHGPAALLKVKLSNGDFMVKGHDVAAFTNEEEDAMKRREIVPFTCEDLLKENGGFHKSAGVFKACVAVRGNLYTGQNPPSASPVAEEIVKKL